MVIYSRRSALRTIIGGAGALLLSPYITRAARRNKEKLGVALVGLGYYATDLLAPALQQTRHCYLAGVVTGTPSKVPAWQQRYGIPDRNVYSYQEFDRIASNQDIDVVYVVLPPSMHREFSVRAAAAGKHVWCEKPMEVSSAACREMISACRKHGKSLSIGYRLHHDPHWKAFRGIVGEKQLGAVRAVQCAAGYRENRTNHWKQNKALGGGVLGDMGVYAIQGARHGVGVEPLSVLEADISQQRPDIYRNGLDEVVEATLQFPGGVQARIKTSFAENTNFLDIRCEKGDIKLAPYSGYAGLKGESPLGQIYFPYDVPWQQAQQMDNEALAILQGRPAIVPGEEGLKDLLVIEAIRASAASRSRVKV
jgi:glucose-fructose oxidoreductase